MVDEKPEILSLSTERQTEKLLEMFEEISSFNGEPRIHAVINMQDMDTVVVVYDYLAGIFELNKNTHQTELVAIGKNPTHLLGDGGLILLDFRAFTKESDLRMCDNIKETFGSLIEKHEKDYTRDVPGNYDASTVTMFIVDTWQLFYEQSTSIIH